VGERMNGRGIAGLWAVADIRGLGMENNVDELWRSRYTHFRPYLNPSVHL
jgi:hypothetical protein